MIRRPEAQTNGRSSELPGGDPRQTRPAASADLKASSDRRRRLWLKLGVQLVVLAAFVWFITTLLASWPSGEVWRKLVSGERIVAGFAPLIACVVVAQVLRGVRWRILTAALGPTSLREAIAFYGWCFTLVTIMPFRTGELAKAVWVHRRGGSLGLAGAMLVAEKLLDLFVLILVIGVAIAVERQLGSRFAPAGWAVGGAAVLAFVAAMAISGRARDWLGALRRGGAMAGRCGPAASRTAGSMQDRPVGFVARVLDLAHNFFDGLSILSRPRPTLAMVALTLGCSETVIT